MNNIEWEDGKVCYVYGVQHADPIISNALRVNDFQLNEIRQGDYIEASELDTEQKYNDAVEVFGLFGFKVSGNHKGYQELIRYWSGLEVYEGVLASTNATDVRKITYQQLMAIGKLKRAMTERDKAFINAVENTSILSDVLNGNNSELPNSSKHKKSTDYLNECMEVQRQRGEQYDSSGTGERSFNAAAKAFNAMTGQSLKGSDVCLLLTCVKVVRQYSNPERLHEDSLLDGVSYLSLWAEELNKELN